MLTSPTARAAEDQVGGRFSVKVSAPEKVLFRSIQSAMFGCDVWI